MQRRSSRFTLICRFGIGLAVVACVGVAVLPAVSLFQARTTDTRSFYDAPAAESVVEQLMSERPPDVRAAISAVMVHRALLSDRRVMRASIVVLQGAGVRMDDVNLQVLENMLAHQGSRFVDAVKVWSCEEVENRRDHVVSHLLHSALRRAVRNFNGGVILGYEDVDRIVSRETLSLSDLCF